MKKIILTENAIEDRRKLLRCIPVAAIAGLAIADLLPVLASGQAKPLYNQEPFLKVSAEEFAADVRALKAPPRKPPSVKRKSLYSDQNFSLQCLIETGFVQDAFEWHEFHDHILMMIDGTCSCEVGGTPQSPYTPSPNEANYPSIPHTRKAPSSRGATLVTLNKGDFFVVRHGTPHKRTTKDMAVFTLLTAETPGG